MTQVIEHVESSTEAFHRKVSMIVSVIIPTYNRHDILPDTVKHLLDQDYPNYEIIVIDQTKDVPNNIKKFFKEVSNKGVRYIHIDRPGLPNARNIGIKIATGEIILFVDDDIILGKDWFKRVSRYMIKNVGAIEGVDLGKINREYIEIGRYERGLLCATLIRKDVVYDWKPRKGVETNFEDYDLTQHVIKKGFRWFRVNVPGTHSIEIHSHASQTGFETLLGPAFSHIERILYMLNLLRLVACSSFSIIDMAPRYIYSISL